LHLGVYPEVAGRVKYAYSLIQNVSDAGTVPSTENVSEGASAGHGADDG